MPHEPFTIPTSTDQPRARLIVEGHCMPLVAGLGGRSQVAVIDRELAISFLTQLAGETLFLAETLKRRR